MLPVKPFEAPMGSWKSWRVRWVSICFESITWKRFENIYFSVPVVSGPVSGQKIDFVKNSYLSLRDLKLADNEQNKGKIDLLIGEDFYWSVVGGTVKRENDLIPVVLGSKLGWSLSGPVTKYRSSCLATHIENSVVEMANCIIYEKKNWKLLEFRFARNSRKWTFSLWKGFIW